MTPFFPPEITKHGCYKNIMLIRLLQRPVEGHGLTSVGCLFSGHLKVVQFKEKAPANILNLKNNLEYHICCVSLF